MNSYFSNLNKVRTNEFIDHLQSSSLANHIPIARDNTLALLNYLVKVNKVINILEVGSAIGYSSIVLAFNNDVYIDTLEINLDYFNIALANIRLAGLHQKINIVNIDAMLFNPCKTYDLIFIDAAKSKYIDYFSKFSTHLKSNGIIVCDNIKHNRLEFSNNKNMNSLINKIKKFNEWLSLNNNFETIFLDLDDGVSVSIKK